MLALWLDADLHFELILKEMLVFMNRTRLYVGNLPFRISENDLRELFEQYGQVNEINLIVDKMTGQSRGFAFVTMETSQAAQSAIDSLNGTSLSGRQIVVNEAKPREERPHRHRENSGRSRR
ncbi:RNA-binding protein [Methylacidiphilum sp. Yel]|uniref:RNA recognition motif domain-containing protein n=1 Tax=Methylacidiphilum sp. Yel TaxID=1847730 RepID=UPI001FC9C292|nr:RNA-binding protein [Methylacidiphilum sp. Yel]